MRASNLDAEIAGSSSTGASRAKRKGSVAVQHSRFGRRRIGWVRIRWMRQRMWRRQLRQTMAAAVRKRFERPRNPRLRLASRWLS